MKHSFRDLAVLGGEPAFREPLHVGRPNIGDRRRLIERFQDVLDGRWLTNDGPYVEALEQEVAARLDVKHCIATCNGTVALEIAARAVGLSGEVIVPSFTFIATAHALQWLGIKPVFCDIDPLTHNLDPFAVERLLTDRTTGIVGVHVWGRPCPVEALEKIASEGDLRLLFDAAHALGCSHQGKMIGSFGDAEILSFHATKYVNSFEGGAVVTNSADLAAEIRLMRNFGFVGYDQVVGLGTNAKMHEVSAAMGLTSLESEETFTEANRRNYATYKEDLASIAGVQLVEYNKSERCNYQHIVVEIDEPAAGLTRDDLLQLLWADGVLARRYFYPGCHRMEPYASQEPESASPLPQTERLVGRVLSLPTGTSVSEAGVRAVCQLLRLAIENAAVLKPAIRAVATR